MEMEGAVTLLRLAYGTWLSITRRIGIRVRCGASWYENAPILTLPFMVSLVVKVPLVPREVQTEVSSVLQSSGVGSACHVVSNCPEEECFGGSCLYG